MMLKRAWIYLRRKNKRSIILLLLLFVISCSISIGLSVWNNIGDAIKEVEQRMGTSFVMKLPAYTQNPDAGFAVFYETTLDCFTGIAYNGPLLNDELIEKVMQIENVHSYNADVYSWAHVDDAKIMEGLTAACLELDNSGEKPERVASWLVDVGTTQVHGNTSTELSEQFRTGMFTLTEGRHITKDDVHKTLISEELSDMNDLQVGDTITISQRMALIGTFINADELLDEPTDMEIVGIFHVNGFQPTGKWVSEDDITYNWLLTDMQTLKEISIVADKAVFKDYIREFAYDNITFFVDDPTQLEGIIEQVKNLDTIEKNFYDIKIDDTMYRSTTEALGNIRNIVMVLVAVIVVGCAVVMLIVFTMWVRSRRQEISIYLSMGLSKASILGQFVVEAAIIAVLAGTLAFGVCQEVPNRIGNYMLADAIEDAQPDWEEPTREEIHQAAMAGTTQDLFQYTNSEYAGPEQIDFAFRFTDFLVLLLLELLLITAAICKGGWFIFSMQPRKIMTDLR